MEAERRGLELVAELFPQDVCDRLSRTRRPPPASKWDTAENLIRERHRILTPAGWPSGHRLSRQFSAKRRAWARYLASAEVAGLLDAEFCARITSEDDDLFRGALAECLTASFFRDTLGHNVRARPENSSTKNPDFEIVTSDNTFFRVEVKAPYVPIENNPYWGTDSSVIQDCLVKAKGQFKKEHGNVLVVVPLFRTPVHLERMQMVEALIGHPALSVPIALHPNDEPGETKTIFVQDGKMAKPWPGTAGSRTYFTRVSAVLSIEEVLRGDLFEGPREVGHEAVLVHNPFAAHPISSTYFGALPQFILDGSAMRWTDGYEES